MMNRTYPNAVFQVIRIRLQSALLAGIVVLLSAGALAGDLNLAPDGTWVRGNPQLAPDGSWVGGNPQLAPDGTWVGGSNPELAPDGSWR